MAEAAAHRQADLPLQNAGGWRAMAAIANSPLFQGVILFCIVGNAISLGVDAHYGDAHPFHFYIEDLDRYFLAIFTAELVIEFLAAGPRRYFRSGWNVFDVIVVGLSYISMMPFISALRTLRILRVLRLVSAVPQMRRVVEALFGAMPGILATVAVLAVVFYIGAVMATTLFRTTHPAEFGDLWLSLLTLFQLTQFDGWGDLVKSLNADHPWAWAFVMGFTVIAAFAVLNLFIGVIVDAVQDTRTSLIAEDVKEIEEDIGEIEEGVEDISQAQDRAAEESRAILSEVRSLREEIAALRAQLAQPRSF
ncbi:MAG: ion transporter [Alphaproteobacteria bacterium]|jgi:voltage-gated sodium channel|nr:ion transporter [Alphaproteobacteria bacterium]